MSAVEGLEKFINDHKSQLLSCGVPEIYWNTLYEKLKQEVFDAYSYFTFVYDDKRSLYPVVSCDGGLKRDDPNSVFLIDHAWTYEAEFARAQLRSIPGLAKRMASLMDLLEDNEETVNGDNGDEKKPFSEEARKICLKDGFYTNEDGAELPNESVVEFIFQKMWKFNQTYQVKVMGMGQDDENVESPQASSLKEQVCFWYIMDEFGSKIRHSDLPTVTVRCFYYVDREISYSVLFPIQDLDYGAAVTRDFAAGVNDPEIRATVLYPWQPESFVFDDTVCKDSIDEILFPNESRCREKYTEESEGVLYLPKKKTYNVFTDVDVVSESLKAPKYRLVDNPHGADIIWQKDHFKDYASLQEAKTQYINQFPFENVLTCKDLLARVVNRVGVLYPTRRDCPDTTRPPWFQESYNLNFELPDFIHNFRKREQRKADNVWIIKPWNLGRSLDTHVTDNLDQIIRLRETGPKIAFKYIRNPVLFEREDVGKVKFHFRYMAAVTSVDPLIIDIDEVFWIGCANKPFSLDDFDVYEKHFTTMNYRQEVTLKQVHHHEFPEMFDHQYPGYKWQDVENEVHKIIKELFEAATSELPPKGIGHCKMSRAYYALDFMLKWKDKGSERMQPVLLEVNFNPDCNRLVKYHPDSFHHLFSILFLGEETPWGCVRL
ncbi:tubulin--tyrosine ligase-like protein 12 [Dendronephthya gigantea]|uniref:tubulin--tyrosine ligase-like protein 12 n=1 Tax=Dendronephthya gigantea TaxID=151771 RepID=UPI00106B9DEC|nr:tubulin--tyrosine ligase-like protein 12 [Dendronephthya gigantea]